MKLIEYQKPKELNDKEKAEMITLAIKIFIAMLMTQGVRTPWSTAIIYHRLKIKP